MPGRVDSASQTGPTGQGCLVGSGVAGSDPRAVAGTVRLRTRVMLVISSLEHGGAERQVLALAEHLDPERFEAHVCSLSPHLPLARDLASRVPVHLIPKRWRFDLIVVARLARLLWQHHVDIVHSFLFDAEIAARLAGRLARVGAVIGSERNSDYQRPRSHDVALRVTRSMSDALVANSEAGRQFNLRTLGLPASHIHVVYNGVDTARFAPRAAGGLRRDLGIEPRQPVVGMVATFKRQKNYEMYFHVARQVAQALPDVRFVCVGDAMRDGQQGSDTYRREMRALVEALGIGPRLLWLGTRDDMPDVYSTFDVAVLTSRREGTPNVLLEAMATGVPVVVTDVADNAVHVVDGVTGFVVPLDDVEAMALRVLTILADAGRRRMMGDAARLRAVERYSLAAMARSMGAVYERVLARRENR
jgi:glycosyltransferase involved in cell wall biosynthesis